MIPPIETDSGPGGSPKDGFYEPGDDLLWRHLKRLPAFRSLLRSVEARFYAHIDLPEPTLDLGCGDGVFALLTFDRPVTAGVDPWWGPLQKAKRAHSYQLVAQSNGSRLPFSRGSFASVFSNSVLEHIPDVQPVLQETNRVLRTGGLLVFTTPSHYFTEMLAGARIFERLGLRPLAEGYRRLFNYISRHERTDSPERWCERLAVTGFAVERWQYYFSKEALWTLELGHLQGLPAAVLHFLTGHWILAPWQSSLRPTERWVRPYYQEPFPEKGTMLLIKARKVGPGPVPALLPPPEPFDLRAGRD